MESLPVDKDQHSLHIPCKQTQLVSRGIKTGNPPIQQPYVDAKKTTTVGDVRSSTFIADCNEESHEVKPLQKDSGNTSICRLCNLIFDSEHSLSLHRKQVHSDVIFMQTDTKSVPHPVTSTVLEQDVKVLQENQAASNNSLGKRPVTEQSLDVAEMCPVTSSNKEVDFEVMSTTSSHEFDPDQLDLDDDIIEINLWPDAQTSPLDNGSKMDFEIVSTASSSDLEANHNEINADVQLSDTEAYESDSNSDISKGENELKIVETNVQKCKQDHNSIHKQKKMFQCDSCNKRFLHKVTLQNHEKVCKMATKNEQKKLNGVMGPELDESSKLIKYKCPGCRKTYGVLQDFRKHQEMCSAKEENSISSKNISSTEKLIWKKTYMCLVCKKVYSHYRTLWSHNKVHHSGTPKFSEIITEKSSLREEEQITPKKKSKKGNKYGCHKCDKWYNFRQGLQKHKKTHHLGEAALKKSLAEDPETTTVNSLTIKRSQEKPSYVCELCQKSYASKPGLKYHYKTHFRNKQPACKQCNKTYAERHELQNHMKRCHAKKGPDFIKPHSSQLVGQNNNSQIFPMPCDACEKIFYSAKSLQMHKYQAHRGHTNRKFAKRIGNDCLPCGRKFSTRRGLNLHNIHVHGGNIIRKGQENVCCNKRFPSKLSLKMHTLKVHGCEQHKEKISTGKNKNENICCGKTFSTKLGLRTHHYQVHNFGYRGNVNRNDKENIYCDRKFSSNFLGLQMQFLHSKQERNTDRKDKDQIVNMTRNEKENICCGRKFSTKAGFRMHNRMAHSNAVKRNNLKCLQCDRIFSNKRGLILHNHFKHKGTTSLERSPKNTRQTKLMQTETDENERSISCRICNRTFGTGEELHKHFRTSSCALGSMASFSIDKGNKDPEHNDAVCELQSLQLSKSSNFEPQSSTCYSGNKYESSDEEDNFQCGLCLLCFPDDTGLLSHMEGVHNIHKPHRKEGLCGNDGKEFENSSENCKTPVENMFAIHESFLCGICNETFHNEFALDSHMNIHLQHEYKCGQCSLVFPSSEHVVNHVLTFHQGKSIEMSATQPSTKFGVVVSTESASNNVINEFTFGNNEDKSKLMDETDCSNDEQTEINAFSGAVIEERHENAGNAPTDNYVNIQPCTVMLHRMEEIASGAHSNVITKQSERETAVGRRQILARRRTDSDEAHSTRSTSLDLIPTSVVPTDEKNTENDGLAQSSIIIESSDTEHEEEIPVNEKVKNTARKHTGAQFLKQRFYSETSKTSTIINAVRKNTARKSTGAKFFSTSSNKAKISEHDETSTNKEEIPESSDDSFIIEIDEDEQSSEIKSHTLYETEDISYDDETLIEGSEQEPEICQGTAQESSKETISLNTSITEINETNDDEKIISTDNSDVDDDFDMSDKEIVVILEDEEDPVTTINHTQTSSKVHELPKMGTNENINKSATNKLIEEKQDETKKAAINVTKTTISYASEQTDLIMEVETVINDKIVQLSSQETNILEAVTPKKRSEVNASRNKQEEGKSLVEVAVDAEKTTTSYFNDEVIIIEDDTKTSNRNVPTSSTVIEKSQTPMLIKLLTSTTENKAGSNISRNKLDLVKKPQKEATTEVEKTKTSYFNDEVIIIDEETKTIDRNAQPSSGGINKHATNSQSMLENSAGQNKLNEVKHVDSMKPLIGVVKTNISPSVKYHPGLKRFVFLYPAKENLTHQPSASVKELPKSECGAKDQLSTHITSLTHLLESVAGPPLPVKGSQIDANTVKPNLSIDSNQTVNNTAESTLSTDSSLTENSKAASSCDKSLTDKTLAVTSSIANDKDNVNNNKPVNNVSKLLAYKPKFI